MRPIQRPKILKMRIFCSTRLLCSAIRAQMNSRAYTVLGQRCTLGIETMTVLWRYLNMHARVQGHQRKKERKKIRPPRRLLVCMLILKFGNSMWICLKTLAKMNRLKKLMKEWWIWKLRHLKLSWIIQHSCRELINSSILSEFLKERYHLQCSMLGLMPMNYGWHTSNR